MPPEVSPPILRRNSRISAVNVFADHADVTRVATVSVEAQTTRIVLTDLPAHVDPSTLRASVSRGVVRAVEFGDVMPVEHKPATGDLEPPITELEERVYGLTGEAEALAAELDLIDRLMPGRGHDGLPAGPLRPENFLLGLDTIVNRRRETLYALRVAEYERELATDELENARLHQQKNTTVDTFNTRPIIVSVESEEAIETLLSVTYPAGFATWRPYYNLRLDPAAKTVEIIRLADVWQETGEDWTQVDITLSTAEPADGLSLPFVEPWYLERSRGFTHRGADLYRLPAGDLEPALLPPPLPVGPVAGGGAIAGLLTSTSSPGFGDDDETTTADLSYPNDMLPRLPSEPPLSFAAIHAPTPTPTPQQYVEEGIFTEVTARGTRVDLGPSATQLVEARRTRRPTANDRGETHTAGDYLPSPKHPDLARFQQEPPPRDAAEGLTFELVSSVPATVVSGHERHRLTLGRTTLPAHLGHMMRPALTDHAFGRVVAINDGRIPILQGTAGVFVPSGYIGTVRVQTTPAGGRLELDLGADTTIKCTRRARTSVRTEGLITREDVHVVDVAIEIENDRAEAIQVEVQDQVPISTDAKVRVRLMKTEPRDAKLDDITGVITFDVQVAARGRVDVLLSYEIETPKGYRLTEALER